MADIFTCKKYRIFTCEFIWIFSVAEILIKHWCLYNSYGYFIFAFFCRWAISHGNGIAFIWERRFTARKHTCKYTFETSLQSLWDLSSKAIIISILTRGCLKRTQGMTHKDPLRPKSLIIRIYIFKRGDSQHNSVAMNKPSKPSCRDFEIFAVK